MTYMNRPAERADRMKIVQTECVVFDAHDFGCGLNTNLRTVRFAHDDVTCPVCGYDAINVTLASYGIEKIEGDYTWGIQVHDTNFEDYAIAWGTDLSDWGVE